MSAVVVKQGKPSKPGEVIDTSAAKIVPPSSEVKQEVAVREVAAQKAAGQKKIDALAKSMASSAKVGEVKPAATKPRGTGNGGGPTVRLTDEWLSAKKNDVKVKDEVTVNGVVITSSAAGRSAKATRRCRW